jgi:hypothetical protein
MHAVVKMSDESRSCLAAGAGAWNRRHDVVMSESCSLTSSEIRTKSTKPSADLSARHRLHVQQCIDYYN